MNPKIIANLIDQMHKEQTGIVFENKTQAELQELGSRGWLIVVNGENMLTPTISKNTFNGRMMQIVNPNNLVKAA